MIPREKYIGPRLGGEPSNEAEHFIKCPSAVPGSICAIWPRSWTLKADDEHRA